jgi:hypothetical protein
MEDRADPFHITGIPSNENDTSLSATERNQNVEHEAAGHAGEVKDLFRPQLRERPSERVPRSHR